ncbi:hypothetical protein BU26DRAFT_558934 [Trematosphaeria pertusa]|uniref:DUF7924 domain-containing protein n=1 Tax=Trematosphaeria pertusa TaxID=390896 RepID=A0A6A6IUV3_9PLEO|nr:uncharacterized protein BU26DRAFT_558934 [Trematosphaeria pertusa]KAF2254224.1 hypothetical protein BU26DRAFT_558934 [Trematosphaeria pertusa]
MPPASESESGQSNPVDSEQRLRAYGVFVDTQNALPDALNEYINVLIKAPREHTSPSARNMGRKQGRARAGSEQAGIDLLKDHLLFVGEADGGIPLITYLPQVNLSRTYLPAPPTELVAKELGLLTQPRPDSLVGYITSTEAETCGSKAPITPEQERIFLKNTLTSSVHFPFLSCQWKSSKKTQNEAMLQAARDGSTISNYLHDFFTAAGHEPSLIDTSHFSLTCDMNTVHLWVHWRQEEGDVKHFMKIIGQAFLRDIDDDGNPQLVKIRKMLRNLLDYAVGARLQKIRSAIPDLEANKARKRSQSPRKGRRCSPTKCGSDTLSLPSAKSSNNLFNMPPPHLPSPTLSETKKQKLDPGAPD